MDKTGKYIYGITDAPQDRIAEAASDLKGINDTTIKLVSHQDITALVSDTPIINFDDFNKEKLHQYVTAHQQAVEALARNINIVPMRFGMIVEKEKELLDILKRAYLQFILALNKIQGKAEFILQVLWNEQAFLTAAIAATESKAILSPSIKKKYSQAEKLEMGRTAFELVEKHRNQHISDIQDKLKKVALDTCPGKLRDKDTILNLSLLIKKDEEGKLDKIINKLAEKHNKLKFKYCGPLPIYSFVNIDLSLGDFELIDRARQTLNLSDEATLFDIKQTYRRLALQHHPDKQGSEEDMKHLAQAYEILENYCRNYVYSFKEKDVHKVVINKNN